MDKKTTHQHGATLYWTKARVIEAASNYSSKRDFYINERGAYLAAYRNNWMKLIYSDKDVKRRGASFWTKEKVIEAAKKYTVATDFRKHETYAYNIAKHMGWFDELTWIKFKGNNTKNK